jgi:23S rRNA-/tRNA-specific pseudouridylate synthase
MRISKALSVQYGFSTRLAKKYIKDGQVKLNGSIIKKDLDYTDGELELSADTKRPEVNPLDYVAREFDNLVFFDKPAFIHTDLQKPDDPLTMHDILRAYSDEFGYISRLDYTTDGVICAVRNGFFVFETKKVYLALTSGHFEKQLTVDNKIDADKRRRVKVLDEQGGYSTLFTPVKKIGENTLVQAEIEKAARHQLRAYLSHLGHPIVGDELYDGTPHDRVMLHCKETYVNRFPGASNLTEKFIDSCDII